MRWYVVFFIIIACYMSLAQAGNALLPYAVMSSLSVPLAVLQCLGWCYGMVLASTIIHECGHAGVALVSKIPFKMYIGSAQVQAVFNNKYLRLAPPLPWRHGEYGSVQVSGALKKTNYRASLLAGPIAGALFCAQIMRHEMIKGCAAAYRAQSSCWDLMLVTSTIKYSFIVMLFLIELANLLPFDTGNDGYRLLKHYNVSKPLLEKACALGKPVMVLLMLMVPLCVGQSFWYMLQNAYAHASTTSV